jgi:hypothetical protein
MNWLIQLYQTLLSCGKIAIRSRFGLKGYKAGNERIVIIGNGPSASEFLQNLPAQAKNIPLLAVNMFAGEQSFTSLQPAFYLMSDHAFFEFEEQHFHHPEKHPLVKKNPAYAQTQTQVNRTWQGLFSANWPIVLFVPQIYSKSYPVKKAMENPALNVVVWNYTVVKGFSWFENFIYAKGLGSPQCQNVVNACIFQAINAQFKEIYLVGIDNNFHRNISVGQDNHIYITDNHFYEVDKKVMPLMRVDSNGKPVFVQLHQFFNSLSKAFYAYNRLRSYADCRKVRVFNSTAGSFVDAFERKLLNEL